MKVKIKRSIAAANFSYRKGQVVDMPKEQAEAWIEGGNAEKYSGETATVKPKENAKLKTQTKRAKK